MHRTCVTHGWSHHSHVAWQYCTFTLWCMMYPACRGSHMFVHTSDVRYGLPCIGSCTCSYAYTSIISYGVPRIHVRPHICTTQLLNNSALFEGVNQSHAKMILIIWYSFEYFSDCIFWVVTKFRNWVYKSYGIYFVVKYEISIIFHMGILAYLEYLEWFQSS